MYPFIAENILLILENGPYDNINNRVGRPIYLPVLDVAGGSNIDPATDTVVEQELAEGGMAAVTVKQGTLKNDDGSDFTGVLSITEVPVTLTPAALPANVSPDAVVTVQPGEMNFDQPARISLPNRSGMPPERNSNCGQSITSRAISMSSAWAASRPMVP